MNLHTVWNEWAGLSYKESETRKKIQRNLDVGRDRFTPSKSFYNLGAGFDSNKLNGKRVGVAKAKATKTASKAPETLDDMQPILELHEAFSYVSFSVKSKAEPALFAVRNKFEQKVWEPVEYLAHNSIFEKFNKLHLLHISTEDETQVAYYPSLKHLRDGREVRTKLGRYLTKYSKAFKLSETDVKTIAEAHAAKIAAKGRWELKFVEHDDPQGWIEVYDEGPQSCMKNESAVGVYAHAASDLKLAYLYDGDDILGRCIVRDTDGKQGYLRVYPDPQGSKEGTWLLNALEAAGYEQKTNLNGCLLRWNGDDYEPEAPYIDRGCGGSQYAEKAWEGGKSYLRITLDDGAEFLCDNTNGKASNNRSNRYSCDECGDDMDEDDGHWIEDEEIRVCEHCADAEFVQAYGRGSFTHLVRNDSDVVEVNGNYYVIEYAQNHDIYNCEQSGEWYYIDDMVSTMEGWVYEGHATELDHEDREGNRYASDNHVTKLSDGTTCHDDEVHTLSNGTTCHEDEADDMQQEIDDAEYDSETETENTIADVVTLAVETNNEYTLAA